MIFCLKEDDPHLFRSLDKKRTSLGLGVWRGQPKYIEVFDSAMTTGLPHEKNELHDIPKCLETEGIPETKGILLILEPVRSDVQQFSTCRQAST